MEKKFNLFLEEILSRALAGNVDMSDDFGDRAETQETLIETSTSAAILYGMGYYTCDLYQF